MVVKKYYSESTPIDMIVIEELYKIPTQIKKIAKKYGS